jgi:hypothetical protein
VLSRGSLPCPQSHFSLFFSSPVSSQSTDLPNSWLMAKQSLFQQNGCESMHNLHTLHNLFNTSHLQLLAMMTVLVLTIWRDQMIGIRTFVH